MPSRHRSTDGTIHEEAIMTRLTLFRACLAAALIVLPACGDDNEPFTTPDYTGTWVGEYTVSLQPGVTYEGCMTVSGSGNS
jgi:hypothetical protein